MRELSTTTTAAPFIILLYYIIVEGIKNWTMGRAVLVSRAVPLRDLFIYLLFIYEVPR